MKLIYIGHANSPDFYTQRTESNIKGYSKTIEQNDLFYFDRKLEGGYSRLRRFLNAITMAYLKARTMP